MRIVRTAAFALVVSALSACSGSGITDTDPVQDSKPSVAGATQTESTAPRMNGGFIGSGS